MASFPDDVLDLLRDVKEIEIETVRKSGATRRTIIWIVVDDGDVFVRSEYGNDGWWYRHLLERPDAVVHPRSRDRTSIRVHAVTANDPESIERCSAAIRRKYRPGGSVDIMTRSPALESTLRLEPADAPA